MTRTSELQLEGLLCHWAAPLSPLTNMSRESDDVTIGVRLGTSHLLSGTSRANRFRLEQSHSLGLGMIECGKLRAPRSSDCAITLYVCWLIVAGASTTPSFP